jgi:hypothetical protein
MGELIVLALLYGGGMISAAFFMVIATFWRRRMATLVIFVALSFISLLAQAGCWKTAAGIGRATGGSGGDDSAVLGIVGIGFVVCFVWSLLLFGLRQLANYEKIGTAPLPPTHDSGSDEY